MLNIDPVVQVNVSVGTNVVSAGVFDVGAILTPTSGSGTALTKESRFAVYSGLSDVASGSETTPSFDSTSDVYIAAEKYFGVSPSPAKLVVIYYETDPDAEEYSSTKAYAIGDYCLHEGDLFVCNTAIASPGETWTAAHWDSVPKTTDTPTGAMLDAIEKGAEFYGVYYSANSADSAEMKSQLVSIASALMSLNNGVLFYGVTGTVNEIISDNGTMKTMANMGIRRALGLACTTSVDDAAGVMGIAMGYARNARNRAFALCYKSVPSISVNPYKQDDVENIHEINGNVYVARTKTRAGLEVGAVASGLRFDDTLYLDMISHDIQTGIYSTIADNPTKLPQNDSTTVLFISEINRILEGYYSIGILHDAEWRGTLYNDMEEGTLIEHGYMAFAGSFDDQSTADRAMHKAMPITILLCMAGAVESIVINLDVQT